jgi:addiction module RelE/StbE family toxin
MSMFCNGDLDPDTKRAVCRDRGIKPPDFVKALKGDYAGYYRYRIGDYRVIYAVDDELVQVFVVAIAHRSEAYEP